MSHLIYAKKNTPVYLAAIIAAVYLSSLFLVPISTSAYYSAPAATKPPKVLLRPLTSSPGKSVKVTGLNFTPNAALSVKFNGISECSQCSVNSTGGFVMTFIVPAGTKAGSYPVVATDHNGITASNTLTVKSAVKIILSTGGKAHTVGTTVTISGAGFSLSTTITVLFGGTQVATTTSNSSGGFQTTFGVPAMPAGTYTVSASDGTTTGKNAFKLVSHISANPEFSVAPGSTIVVTGTGYAANSMVTFTLGAVTLTGTATSDSTGQFSAQVQIPSNTVKGGYSLIGTDQSANNAKVRVTVA